MAITIDQLQKLAVNYNHTTVDSSYSLSFILGLCTKGATGIKSEVKGFLGQLRGLPKGGVRNHSDICPNTI
jgi:hypothetical protein